MIEKHKKDEIDSYKTIDKIRDEVFLFIYILLFNISNCIFVGLQNFKLEKSLNSMKKNNEVLKLDCIKLQVKKHKY